MSSTGEMLAKALALAAAGFAVFPLAPNSKQPVPGSNGHKDATLDPSRIVELWVNDKGVEYNIGIYPWACRPRMMVVDLDLKGEENGRDTLEALELSEGLLPETLRVRTPGGGEHAYFAVPDDAPEVPSSVRRIGPGVDVRASGGYVVAPGSEVSGREYEVLSANAVAMAPAWIIERAGRRMGDAGTSEPGVELDLPENINRAKDYLQREASAGRVAIAGRGGNNFTYRTAGVVRDFGVSEGTCVALLAANWNPHCRPPWSWDELQLIVQNVYAYAQRPAGAARTASPDALEEAATRAKAAAASAEAEPAATPASRFRVLTWPDIMSMKSPVMMVEGSIPERSVVEIYGPYSSYKSFLALDIALSAATGVEWARRACARKYRSLYVAGEGAYGVRQRAAAWSKARELQSISGFNLLPVMPTFADDADLRGFAEAVLPYRPELIVLDTAAHAMAGLDENAAKDVGIFAARLFELRDALGCAVVLVHHAGKDVSRGSRGSTALPAAMDTIFRVEAPRPLEAIMTMEKQKDAEPWRDPQGFRGAVVERSLVFRPDTVAPGMVDRIEEKRLEALATVLERLPEDVTIETKPLAYEMALVLNPTLDDEGRQKLASAVRQWLNRSARDELTVQKFIAQKGGKGEGANLWRRPKTEDVT